MMEHEGKDHKHFRHIILVLSIFQNHGDYKSPYQKMNVDQSNTLDVTCSYWGYPNLT